MYGEYMRECGASEAGPTGHYELRDERPAGLVGVYWCPPGGPASVMVRLGAERVGLLAEAIADYLDGNPTPDAG
jgi:hypothetical protein